MSAVMDYPLPLVSAADRQAAQRLIAQCGLCYESRHDDLLGLFDGGQLVGCGARAGRVLKMLTVAPDYRGGGLIGHIVAELMRRGREAGCDGFFIFTRACSVPAFQSLGFKPLIAQPKAVWLEHGNALQNYLRRQSQLAQPGQNGALLLDTAPTEADRARIAAAAAQVDTLYVLVRPTALAATRHATALAPNVIVTDTGPYRLDPATFPTYFLAPNVDAAALRQALNDELFNRHLAPLLHIQTRFGRE